MPRALALVLLLSAVPTAARAECEVHGVASIDRLRVRIEGEHLRTFEVTNLPVAVRPGEGNTYRDVRILAPISFAARTDAPIPWTIARPAVVADGMVWLTPAVDVEDVRERGDELLVRMQVDNGVWISRVHLPCDAIAVGHGESGEDPPRWSSRGVRWQPRGDDLWLTSRPGEGEGASIRLDAPEGLPLPLVEVERREGWIRVVARFTSGAAVRGWTRPHQLVAATPPVAAPPPFRRTMRAPDIAQCTRGAPDRNEYVGPANIATGTLVHMERSGTVWASVAEPALFTVSWHMGSDWVRIVHVPGMRGDGPCPEVLRRAWVPRRSVSLQGEGDVLLGIE